MIYFKEFSKRRCTVSEHLRTGGNNMTDEDYLVALLNRDEEALKQLMADYSKLMWAIASKYLVHNNMGSSEDIEELISDVFIRLWNHPKGFDPNKGSIKTYLGMLTRSMAVNKLKVVAKNQHEWLEQDRMDQLTEEESNMDWDSFYEAVMSLEPTTRDIIIKRYFFEMKPSEIQKETGYDTKLIDNKLYYGKKQLAKQFKELGGELR